MQVLVQIPDDLGQRLRDVGDDLSRRVVEALALEEYKKDRLTESEMRRILGFETGDQLDTFLKAHDVWIGYDMEDFAREREGLRRLGF